MEPQPENDMPSCQGCRRRKLRCSRDQPICVHCSRLGSECVYDLKKNKPGLRPGAVESLNRRVEALEQALQGGQHGGQQASVDATASLSNSSPQAEPFLRILTTLASELAKLNERVDKNGIGPGSLEIPPKKRRRLDSCGNLQIDVEPQLEELGNISATLPPRELLDDILTAYFTYVQPWIPILHETTFRRRLQAQDDPESLTLLLHAIVVGAIRLVPKGSNTNMLSENEMESQTVKSRNNVLLGALSTLSVENLQGLIIIAFTEMGNGQAAKAWSIIGSITRTVEFLHLNVEPEDRDRTRSWLLPPNKPERWVEEEQERRVFWNIFNLDRYCSVTTGWNTSLTAENVHRKLPADGGLWHKSDPVGTPFFGIWDRSVAKLGNSVAFLPARYPLAPNLDLVVDPPHSQRPQSHPETPNTAVSADNPAADATTIGAFAYCIEATESLSRVTTYFLQQPVNYKDRQDVGNWLTRFKELDIRLVHWKMFLPARWSDSNVSRLPTIIEMDPNLTLAHITHNTSMILLHHRIAYPPPQWSNIIRLPSDCSAETCYVAAIETANITEKYLRHTHKDSPVNSQFALCVFISARLLLVHEQYGKGGVSGKYFSLLNGLEEMARRWVGPSRHAHWESCLAGIYVVQLRLLHQSLIDCPEQPIQILPQMDINGHPIATGSSRTPKNSRPEDGPSQSQTEATTPAGNWTPASSGPGPGPGRQNIDELSSIGQMLLDPQFLEMDRIISFDDVVFSRSEQLMANGVPSGMTSGMQLQGWLPDPGT